MDEAREYYAKENKSVRERQIYNFTHIWNLRNKTKKPRNRLLTTENKLMVTRGEVGGGWARWVMGIKEGVCCDEHWVLFVNSKLNSTPETNLTLYVN